MPSALRVPHPVCQVCAGGIDREPPVAAIIPTICRVCLRCHGPKGTMFRDHDRSTCHDCRKLKLYRHPEPTGHPLWQSAIALEGGTTTFDLDRSAKYQVALSRIGTASRLDRPIRNRPFFVAWIYLASNRRWFGHGGFPDSQGSWNPLDGGLDTFVELSPREVLGILMEARLPLTPELERLRDGDDPLHRVASVGVRDAQVLPIRIDTAPLTLDEHVALIERYEAGLAREKSRLTGPYMDRLQAVGAKFLGPRPSAEDPWWDYSGVSDPDHQEEAFSIRDEIRAGLRTFAEVNRPRFEPYDTPAKLAEWIEDQMGYLSHLAWDRKHRGDRSCPYPLDPPEYAEDKAPNVYRQARRRVLAFDKFHPDIARRLPSLADPILGLQGISAWCKGVIPSPGEAAPVTATAPEREDDGPRCIGSIGHASPDEGPPYISALIPAMLKCRTVEALLKCRADEATWPGIRQLAALVKELAGTELDHYLIVEWVEPRLRRLGLVPERMTVAEAAEAIDRGRNLPYLVCQRCHGRREERKTDEAYCDACDREEDEAHRATMGPLVLMAEHEQVWSQLIGKVGPVIRELSCRFFHHRTFTMSTWRRLVDWLASSHGLEGDSLRRTLRTRVVELLKSGLGLAPGERRSEKFPAVATVAEPGETFHPEEVATEPVRSPSVEQLRELYKHAECFREAMRERRPGWIHDQEVEWQERFLSMLDSINFDVLAVWESDLRVELPNLKRIIDELLIKWGWTWARLPEPDRRRHIEERRAYFRDAIEFPRLQVAFGWREWCERETVACPPEIRSLAEEAERHGLSSPPLAPDVALPQLRELNRRRENEPCLGTAPMAVDYDEGIAFGDVVRAIRLALEEVDAEQRAHHAPEIKPGDAAPARQDPAPIKEEPEHSTIARPRPVDPIIPPQYRTIPMTILQAAQLLHGKSNAEAPARALGKSIKNGDFPAEKLGRQRHIFDIRKFHQDCWDRIRPKN